MCKQYDSPRISREVTVYKAIFAVVNSPTERTSPRAQTWPRARIAVRRNLISGSPWRKRMKRRRCVPRLHDAPTIPPQLD